MQQWDYSYNEYADMHLILGEISGNTAVAVRLYRERYPNRRVHFWQLIIVHGRVERFNFMEFKVPDITTRCSKG